MLLSEYTNDTLIDDKPAFNTISMSFPGDDDDEQDGDGDWTDVDDEDFEDMAGDMEDLHQIKINNDIYDPEDADHLPEDDD